MGREPVEVVVGGKPFRLVTSADEASLRRFAATVDAKLRQVSPPGKPIPPQAMLLVAIALAHDVELERERRHSVTRRWRESLRALLDRVDSMLALATGGPGMALSGVAAEGPDDHLDSSGESAAVTVPAPPEPTQIVRARPSPLADSEHSGNPRR